MAYFCFIIGNTERVENVTKQIQKIKDNYFYWRITILFSIKAKEFLKFEEKIIKCSKL